MTKIFLGKLFLIHLGKNTDHTCKPYFSKGMIKDSTYPLVHFNMKYKIPIMITSKGFSWGTLLLLFLGIWTLTVVYYSKQISIFWWQINFPKHCVLLRILDDGWSPDTIGLMITKWVPERILLIWCQLSTILTNQLIHLLQNHHWARDIHVKLDLCGVHKSNILYEFLRWQWHKL